MVGRMLVSILGALSLSCASAPEPVPRPSAMDPASVASAPQPDQAMRQVTSDGEYLRWNFGPSTPHAQIESYSMCEAESVSWIDGRDQVVWTRPLPPTAGAATLTVCECRNVQSGAECAAEVADYRRAPRTSLPPFVFATLVDAGASVLTAHPAGVHGWARADGAPTLQFDATPSDPARSYFVDKGSFAIDGDPSCRGELIRAKIFKRCGERILYFNGSQAALIRAADLAVLATGTYDAEASTQGGPGYRTRIRLGDEWLEMAGIVYMR